MLNTSTPPPPTAPRLPAPPAAVWSAVCAAVALSAGCRLFLAWSSVESLVSKSLPDDAFYYFQIARHLADGHGPSFDGLTATNGFHPLWLALISPFFMLFPGHPDVAIHLALTLGIGLSVATAVVAAAITRRLSGDALAAALTLLLYAFNAYVAMESMNGLETALGNLGFAATAWYYLAIGEAPRTPQAVLLGALAGVSILARTDTVFLLGAILLGSVGRQRSWAGVRTALLAGGVAALIVAPWVAWSALVAGSVIQSSGLAVPFVLHGNLMPQHGAESLPMWIAANTLAGIMLAWRYAGVPWGAVPLLLAVVVVAAWGARRARCLRRQLAQMNFVVVALLALILFHSAYRLFPRGWYFVPAGLLSAVYLGVVFAHAREAFARRRAGLALASVAVLLVAGLNTLEFRALWLRGVYPWQAEMLAAARWVGGHTTASDRIGAFNAGIIGYWNPQRTVINLDGVVNTAAFAAIRQRRLWVYVQQVRIAYLVDYEKFLFAPPADLRYTYAPYMGTSLAGRVVAVGRIPGTLVQSDIVILKVNTDAAGGLRSSTG